MIEFQKITFKNFLSTGDVPVEIKINETNTTLISGTNGVGKSTLLDAINYALYNKAYRNINKPNLVNSVNQKGLLVELFFRAKNNNYKIIRGIKPNIFEIYENDNLLGQTASPRDYQKILEETIIGMNEKVFQQIVIIGSTNYVPFMRLPAAQRREVVEELLDVRIFAYMLDVAKKNLSDIKEQILTLDNEIDRQEDKVKVHKKYSEENKQKIREKITKNEEEISQLKQGLTEKIKRIETIKVKQGELSNTLNDLKKWQKKNNEINDLRTDILTKSHTVDKQIKFFETHSECPTCKQSLDNAERVKTEKMSDKERFETALAKLDKKLQTINSYLTIREDKLNQYQGMLDEINEIQQEIRNDEQFINRLMNAIRDDEKLLKEDDSSQEIDSIQAQIKEKKSKRSVLMDEYNYTDICTKLLKDGGIKTKVIKEYVPYMNKIINDYLTQFGLPIDFHLDEQFKETIRSRYRDIFSYENFSEGEKQRINISILLMWREIAKRKNTTNTNILIMDETFDSSLDNDATDELFNILTTQYSSSNLFIVSHKHDLSDKVDRHIRFEKIGNFSRISE